ncbi:translational regulator orb2 [Uranotaenia lowii]|uniref:translational regulator orb2 n=1 Tax=Uranotaenia lowii TaxID=190385 RepID=UPI002479812B|nr:translational regulator orb2 [Uranotaenia lowii]XP_055605900.1 translational regulator orb2 [Uranotaenia lowii]
MGDFLYGGSVLTSESCISGQSLLDTLSINNLLNIKHLAANGSTGNGITAGGLSSDLSDNVIDNNNCSTKSLKSSNMTATSCAQSVGDSTIDECSGLLISSSQIASSNSIVSIPTITTAISSECSLTASNVNSLALQLTTPHSDDDTSTSSLLNGGGSVASPIASLNNNNNNPNATNNNILVDSSELHLPSAEELNLKASDLGCLSVSSGLINGGGSSSHMILPPNGLNFGSSASDHCSPWSTSIEDSVASSHLSMNGGLGGFQNFSSNHLYNGAAVAAAAAAAAAQQQRRAITGGFPHHGLSPTSSNPNHMMQAHNLQNPSQQSQFKNSYPTWSNPSSSTPWSQQHQNQAPQQQQQHQPNSVSTWNRGRSVPNMNLGNGSLNNMHPRNKPHNQSQQSLSPYANHLQQQQQQQHQQQQHQQLSAAAALINNSPSKYRRSTSYPTSAAAAAVKSSSGLLSNAIAAAAAAAAAANGGGGASCSSSSGGISGANGNNGANSVVGGVGVGVSGFGSPLDVVQLDDARDPFLSAYQDRNTGLSNGLDMRSLEHCLSDIMRNVGDVGSQPVDHLKGFLNCNTNTLQSLAQLHGKLDFQEFIPGKPFFSGLDEHISSDDTGNGGVGAGGYNLHGGQNHHQQQQQHHHHSQHHHNNHHHHHHHPGGHHQLGTLGGSPARSSPHSNGSEPTERFSRKVFVGGLPPDIDEEEITTSFNQYGPLVVDWPHKAESKSYFPPKGYAFLLFQEERSVQKLIETCHPEDDKLYITVSSPTIKNKAVQIRPWRLADADYVLDASMPLDPRKTVFVGGVPRPLKAYELAMIMDRLYGGVCYAGIDTDPELKYPKGAGRVAFSNQQSYIAAISARFVQLQHGDIDKRVEVKPYVLDDQMCDECQGQRCGGKFAPFFCANVTCLQYYCEHCWAQIHSRSGREYHKPLVKEGADRPRAVPFRWC